MDHIQAQRDNLKSNPYELYNPYARDLTMDYALIFPGSPAAEGASQGFTTARSATASKSTGSSSSQTSSGVKRGAPTIPTIKNVIKQGDDFTDTYQEVTDVNKLLDYYRLNVVEGENKSLSNMYDRLCRAPL